LPQGCKQGIGFAHGFKVVRPTAFATHDFLPGDFLPGIGQAR